MKQKNKFILALLSFAQVAFSILSQIVILKHVGVSHDSDVYIAAQAVPTIFLSIIIVVFQSIWLPIFTEAYFSKQFWLKTQGYAHFLLFVFASITLLIIISTRDYWLILLFESFESSQLHLASQMVVLFMLSSLLNCHTGLYVTALRSANIFIITELMQVITMLIFLLAIYILIPIYGIIITAYLALFRSVILFITMHILSGSPAYFICGWKNRRQTIKKFGLLLTGSSLFKTGPLVDKYWSAQVPSGGLTIFNLSQTAITALSSIIDKSICVPTISKITKEISAKNFISARNTYRKSLFEIGIITILVAFLLSILYANLIYILTNWLKMSSEHANDFWVISLILIGYLFASASGSIVTGSFYAMGDMKRPMNVGLLGFTLSIIIKSILFIYFGLYGLAIGTSIYYIFNVSIMFMILEKRIYAKISK